MGEEGDHTSEVTGGGVSRTVGGSEPVSVAVVSAVAEAAGSDVADLPPLYDTIDPDAIDALFDSAGSRTDHLDGYLGFEYAGHEVTIRADGEVSVQPIAPPS